MTRFLSLSRTLVLTGFGSSLALAAVTLSAQQPQNMPTPRYQSPGIGAPAPAAASAPIFPVTPAITPNGEVAEEVIVRVNDQIISRSDVQRGEEILQQEIAQGGPQAGDVAERQRNLLRDLIDQQLLISKAKELNINPDAEVTRRLDEIRKQNNLPSMEALEQAAQRQGVSYEDFKANIRNQLMTQSVVRDEVGRNIHMTHADEEKFYEAHKNEFAVPEQVKLSEILVPVAASATDAEVLQAKEKADGIYSKLKGGADFAATAKTDSGGPTASQGGDLGVFKRDQGQLAKVLEDKVFSQPEGQFTEPIRTRQGFVILKTVEHTQAGTPSLDKVEGEVQNAMYQEQIQPALRAYLTKLREDSYVVVKAGYTDTGASSKQITPTFTAYTAPQPKKKTEVKRRLIAAHDRARLQDAGLTVKGNTVQPLANVQLDKHGKPKKVKREKVRFGQAPREALPEENTDTATVAAGAKEPSASGQDALGTPESNPALAGKGVNAGAFGSGSGTGPANAGVGGNGAPGTQLAPVTTSNTVAANEGDALAPVAPERKKTRYADREPEVKERKKQVKVTKAIDRVAARPDAATVAEKRDAAQQATALGLNGDTAKKKKKRQKGEAKERLQQTTPEKKPDLIDNGLPDRLHQQNGPQQMTGTPSASSRTGNLPAENSKEADKQRRGRQPVTADSTTLPAVNQPAPGTTVPTQTPSENGTTTPAPGTLNPNPTLPPPQ